MSIVVPGGGDLTEFGRRLYRNLPINDQFDQQLPLEAAAVQSLRQVRTQAHLEGRQVPLISLSPSLTGALQESGNSSRIHDASDASSALLTASDWLESSGEDVVLLFEAHTAPQVVCTLLISEYRPALDNSRPIYARLTGAAQADAPITSSVVSDAIKEAHWAAGIPPMAIGLVMTPTLENPGNQQGLLNGLLEAFDSQDSLTCALSRCHTGLLGLVEITWCLSRRIIPGTFAWTGPAQPDHWQHSPFYVPAESRSWFKPAIQDKRYAGLNMLAADGSFTHILLNDESLTTSQHPEAPSREVYRLFPLAADSVEKLLKKVAAMQSKLASGASLPGIALAAYRQYLLDRPAAQYVACLIGHSPDEFLREIVFALKGIPEAINNQADWQTPLGSSFTPAPLGKDGKISFVYPGAFNSYPGIGRDLFYLFPNLYDHISDLTEDIGGLLNERLLYPRSLMALSSIDLTTIETQLAADPITMIISGSCLAVLFTDILRNTFEIYPASAFGYSLGEISMMYACRVWRAADSASKALRESPLFHTRLSGPQNAVREFWNLPTLGEGNLHEPLWANYLLMVGPEKVEEILPSEARVYLTHINTPRQVVIGGDPAACRRIIDRLKCKSILAPFNYAIHSEPIHSELDMLTELHSNPVMGQPDMTLYSAATYRPMPIEQEDIARQIAQALCNRLDFPRLVHLAYNDGARIFIELGAGSNCARWINDTLQSQPHASYSINRKGVADHLSILRLIAGLVAEHVPINLNVLY
ncbi:MAG: PfaB family protein [Anaerolineales bacterium]